MNATSVIESMNRTLKFRMEIPGQSLAEARAWFSQRSAQLHQSVEYHFSHRQNVPKAWELELNESLEPDMRQTIESLIALVVEYELIANEEDKIMIHGKPLPTLICLVDEDEQGIFPCSCGMMNHTGFPCVHQLFVLRE
jgi:hypothetical protein